MKNFTYILATCYPWCYFDVFLCLNPKLKKFIGTYRFFALLSLQKTDIRCSAADQSGNNSVQMICNLQIQSCLDHLLSFTFFTIMCVTGSDCTDVQEEAFNRANSRAQAQASAFWSVQRSLQNNLFSLSNNTITYGKCN